MEFEKLGTQLRILRARGGSSSDVMRGYNGGMYSPRTRR